MLFTNNHERPLLTMENFNTLNAIVKRLDIPTSTLPHLLPIAHSSIAKNFSTIVNNGELKPMPCNVFSQDLLYFFYGGVFYRSKTGTTKDKLQMPIAFVFSPKILEKVLCLFPFDTGAVAKNHFGKNWSTELSAFEKFKIDTNGDSNIASKIVYHAFENNKNYLISKPKRQYESTPQLLFKLFEFYSTDLSVNGTDQRQCVIECQFNTSISLKTDILWVGFPTSMMIEFNKLCNLIQIEVPQYYDYEVTEASRNPAEFAAILENRAKQDVISRYAER